MQARFAQKQMKAALSYYQAADRGRKNRDWRVGTGSADQNLIPDQMTIVGRSRHVVANTWVGKAAVRAHKRNVIGKGIMVVPTATDAAGSDLPDLNKTAADEFMRWASDRTAVDVEARRTWWQMQRSAVGEEFTAGQSFLIWSYVPHPRRVGLTLQLVETEQLDNTIQHAAETGNEVRNGIEVDGNGRPVAYHFFKRNPSDYLTPSQSNSVRVEADRVLHYFDPERAQQAHGEPRLAPVLQDLRDLNRFREATLWRAMMEACIGLVVRKNMPTGLSTAPGMPYAPGDSGVTPNGKRKIDFTPGMTAELAPGEDVTTLSPTTPGNGYQPFTELTLRGIGAGVGMSFGALTRHNDANYSAARQDMLEDEREIGPQQDAFIDTVALPVWELFYAFAVAEGRFDVTQLDFTTNYDRYVEADFIPPVRPWIDPEKEINAYSKAIELRITTRSQVVAMQGGRFANTLKQIASEKKLATTEGITFPEDVSAKSDLATAEAEAARAGAEKARGESEVAKIDIEKQKIDQQAEQGNSITTLAKRLAVLDAPNYRPATVGPMRCASCSFIDGTKCTAYDFNVTPAWLCDAWEAKPLAKETPSGGIGQPPPLADGEVPFERTSARDSV